MNTIFKYCPNCKSSNIAQKGTKQFCLDCNFEYYHNTAGAVAVIIQKKDEILLTLRNKEPKKGFLDLSGGFIDPQESAEDACVRELEEELFIKINKEKITYLGSLPNTYLYKNISYNTIDMFFLYKDDAIDIKSFDNEELNGFIWKKISEINLDEIAFNSQKKMLSNLLKEYY